MTSIFSENLRIYNAERFKASVTTDSTINLYLTIGKVDSWSNEASPDQANTGTSAFNEVWNNMLGAKRITGNDIRHVIPRHNWTSGTVYDIYDNLLCTNDLFDPDYKFYVVTSDWNVYKCLSNNGGAESTVEPTQTITNNVVEESDGYVWKFMYNITADERRRFMTDEYIPVKTLQNDNSSLQYQVQDNAIEGAILSYLVTDGGENFTTAPTITIDGDGTGATAVANVNTSSNTITRISVINPGINYTFANVNISGTGTGANARAIISPTGGHGSDPLRELGGSNLIINVRLNNTEGGKLPIENEYRQIAIIQNPNLRTTGNTANSSVYSQTVGLTLSTGSSNYIEDELVYQGGTFATAYFVGRVAAWDSANNHLTLTNIQGDVEADVVTGVTSSTARFVESITEQDLEAYSGKLLYIDNISPLQRAIDQTDDVKIIIAF